MSRNRREFQLLVAQEHHQHRATELPAAAGRNPAGIGHFQSKPGVLKLPGPAEDSHSQLVQQQQELMGLLREDGAHLN